MVSLWPWKGEDNSPASFERALAALATKISKSQSHLDSLRQCSRRYKALWTLYTSFAYLLCAVVLFLVVGWKNWTALEYTAVSGSPLIIYLVRTGIATYYTYRIDSVTQRLDDQQAERTKTIEKLKAATKYNSTQELLEKYGGAPPKPRKTASPKTPKASQNQPQRVSLGPPATANIPRLNQMPSQPSTPQSTTPQPVMHRSPLQHITSSSIVGQQQQPGPAEFAPNAFSAPPQYAQPGETGAGPHWYDRVLDLLMGDDETHPKNRVALICQNCRLVNGQAPPGTGSLADLGRWRCFGCGAMNGEVDEAVKVVQEMKKQIDTQVAEVDQSVAHIWEKGVEDSGPESSGHPESPDVRDREATDAQMDQEEDESMEHKIQVKPRGRPKGSKNRV